LAFALDLFWFEHGNLWAAILPFLALPLAVRVVARLLRSPASREYNRLLARAALLHMLFGVLLSAGFILT
jgi:1,4-dihydroxy-2-naphthoate octaprenyltransferase